MMNESLVTAGGLSSKYGLTPEEMLAAVIEAAGRVARRHKCRLTRKGDELMFESMTGTRVPAQNYWSELTNEVDNILRKTAKKRAQKWPKGVQLVRVKQVEKEFLEVESIDGTLYGIIPERLRNGAHVTSGDRVLVSSNGTRHLDQTGEDIVRHVVAREVPEVAAGIVEIAKVGRIAGVRSKITVRSTDPKVDPVSACIGQKAFRISAMRAALNGEKIDVIPYIPDMAEQIAAAFAPVPVEDVTIKDGSAHVYVLASNMTRAIGQHGDNPRLVALLTGLHVDIRSAQRVAS